MTRKGNFISVSCMSIVTAIVSTAFGCVFEDMGGATLPPFNSVGPSGSSSSGDIGTGGSGGIMLATSSSVSSSSSGGPVKDSVQCGVEQCAKGSVCCTTAKGAFVQDCRTADACADIDVTCDGIEDCSGGLYCCGTFDYSPGYFNYSQVVCSSCVGQTDSAICHFGNDNVDCPPGQMCVPEALLGASYGRCSQ